MLQKYETTGGKPPSILPDTEPGAETALKDVVRPAEAPAKKVEKVILSVPGYAESVDYGHPLGKKVLVIRSRFFSHLLLGLVITGVAVFGFYANIKG
ncbi:MAG: hypothetical protein LBQ95_08925, partial [Lachnospiraceae bacterium]|nr:hypothetical protein [Lachnospiraceae bacterium]